MSKFHKNYLNAYLYRQFENNPAEMFHYTRAMEEENLYSSAMASSTDGKFKAVVLSGMRTEDNTGAGTDSIDAKKEGMYLTVVVKPLDIHGATLGDPTSFVGFPTAVLANIEMFDNCFRARSDFEFKDASAPVFGQIVTCYYEDGSIPNSRFSGLRWEKPIGTEIHPDYVQLGATKPIESSKDAFNEQNPSQLGNPPAITEDDDINELARRFDSEQSGYKDRNKRFISIAHPEFQNYIKAFITKCEDNDLVVYLNSTHRTRAEQNELIAKWKAGKRTIEPAQYSYHLIGCGFDFNPVLKNGTWINTDNSKQEWIDTGVVAIGESVGLRWGGHFTRNYDPVHFDFEKTVSQGKMKQMVIQAEKDGVEGNTLQINRYATSDASVEAEIAASEPEESIIGVNAEGSGTYTVDGEEFEGEFYIVDGRMYFSYYDGIDTTEVIVER